MYVQAKAVQDEFAKRDTWKDGFGVLLLEHIFRAMDKCEFASPLVPVKWIDYSDTGGDVVE